MIGLMSRRFMVLRRTGGLRSLGDFQAVTADLCQELVTMALQVVGRGAVSGAAHAAPTIGAGGVRRRIVAALHTRPHLPVPRQESVDELPYPGPGPERPEGTDGEGVESQRNK